MQGRLRSLFPDDIIFCSTDIYQHILGLNIDLYAANFQKINEHIYKEQIIYYDKTTLKYSQSFKFKDYITIATKMISYIKI